MPEHAGCLAPVVHSERYGTGEHFSTNVDTFFSSLSPEGPAHAESSVTASGPMASGVLGRDAGQSPQCLFETFSLGQNPKSHSFFTADVLAVMRGHDPHHEAARGETQDVARQTARHDQAGKLSTSSTAARWHWHWRLPGWLKRPWHSCAN